MKAFNEYNTDGYTNEELESLNKEWESIVEEKSLEPYSNEYDIELKKFQDEVAKR